MSSTPTLTGSHLRTYNAIFQHPAAHNLEWREVRALFDHLADVVEQPNGNLRITRNGQFMVLHPPRTKDVAEIEELMAIRRFLQRSDQTAPASGEAEPRWLVVINHHEARIFRSEIPGAAPERILPHEPEHFFRHAHNSQDFARGQEKPDPSSFFEPVAGALRGTGQILLFGAGTGTGSEMEQFVVWLKHHHAEVATRIIGAQVIDEHHLTAAQLLAKARAYYADSRALSGAAPAPESLPA